MPEAGQENAMLDMQPDVPEMEDEIKVNREDIDKIGTTEDLDTMELEELCQMAICEAPEDSEKRFQQPLKMKKKQLI